jgi:superfamily I DNA/RNA helicase
MTEAVRRVRAGDLHISAGYDGEYGVVSIFDEKERADLLGQSDLFGAGASSRKTVRTKPADGGRKSQKKKEKSPENPEAAPQGTPARYGLNDRQWEAVSSERKAVMVIAGPGTGKTHTLVSRIAYLVDELSADPSSIVAITFTNKAAAEMRGRLSRLFAGRQAMPFIIGTFHGICLELLRKADPADPVSIVDQAPARTILQEVMAEIGAEMPVSEAARVISLAKASGPQGIETLTGDAQAAHAEYKRRLGSLGAMDFDDILLASYEKLRLDESGFSRACGRWKHLLVDEFQDINHLQFSLIKRWGRGAESLFVIGDPHQSIYGFRGSSPRYFGMFEKDFPEVSRISLSRNYRSPAAVVSAARSLISRADGGSGETMVAEATVGNRAGETESVQAGRGEAVRIVETKDEFSEALFITKEIGRMMGGIDMLDAQVYGSQKRRPGASNRGFADFAVIYRTHRQASIIEQCFTKEGIQYRVAGRSDLFDHAEVRRAIAFFRFVLDPDDICSFAQCLAGSGTERVHDILDGYIGAGRGLPALRAVAEIDGYAPQARNDLRSLDELIARFHPRIRRDVPAAVLRDWMTARGIGDDHPAFLIVHCAEMHDTMESFLRTLTLGRDADLVRNGGKTVRTDAVTLTTLHAAKGLEFPVVFLCGVNDGIIPIAPRAGEDVDIEEERRLFYVGVTRTREELICTWSRRRSQGGSPQPGFPSRFLKDMGETGIVRERYLPEPEARQMSFL